LADDWIKFHGSLRAGFWYGVPRSTRFVLLELSHEAKALGGIIELPHGATNHLDGLVDLLGGNRRETRKAVSWLSSTEPPTVVFVTSTQRLTVEIPSWVARNSTTKSTERVRRHRQKLKDSASSGDNETPRNNQGNGGEEKRGEERDETGVSRNAQLTLTSPEPSKSKRKRSKPAPAVAVAWGEWRSQYAEHYGGAYTDGGPDGKVMSSVAAAATRHARTHPDHSAGDNEGETTRVAQLLRHWFACYLANEGFKGVLVEHRPPLRMLERDLARFGLPWGEGAQPTPSRHVSRGTSADGDRFAKVDERAKRRDGATADDLERVLGEVGTGGTA